MAKKWTADVRRCVDTRLLPLGWCHNFFDHNHNKAMGVRQRRAPSNAALPKNESPGCMTHGSTVQHGISALRSWQATGDAQQLQGRPLFLGEEQGLVGGHKFWELAAKEPPSDPKAPVAQNLSHNDQQKARNRSWS